MTARTVDEWVAPLLPNGTPNPDTQPPQRVKIRLLKKFNGRCAECTRQFDDKLKAEFDHERALVLGGENRESNLRPLCPQCHKPKTRRDRALKKIEDTAISKKMLKKEKKRRGGFRGWRKMNGDIVWNDRD